MTKEQENELARESKDSDTTEQGPAECKTEQDNKEETGTDELKKSLNEVNDKYIRLYADFENYKKTSAKNREDLLKYANEELLSDILTVIDHLEMALEHAPDKEASDPLAEGIQLTLKEMRNVLEKHGLVNIEAVGKQFDPYIHHAMSQIETADAEENTVVKEFRKGYVLKDRVLRATLVGVAKKPAKGDNSSGHGASDEKEDTN